MIVLTQKTFSCYDCKQEKPVQREGGTGYGYDEHRNKICYDCCGVRDRQYMETHDRITLYLAKKPDAPMRWERHGVHMVEYLHPHDWEVTNWPGTLRFQVINIGRGQHNIAKVRYDVKFRDHIGKMWHGTQYGDNTQLVHCRRLKG